MNIIDVPEIILNIFEYLSIEEYNNIIKNDLEYFLKVINHEYLINNLWFNFYDSRIDIKNIILNNINKIPEYCNKMQKIIIKENTISKLENVSDCNYLKIDGKNMISKLENIGNCGYLAIYGKNTISKLENIDNCNYLEIGGKNTISKLENVDKCNNLKIYQNNMLKFKI